MLSVNWSGTLKDKWSLLGSNEILIEIGSNGTNNRSWKRAVLPRQLSTVDVPYFYFYRSSSSFFFFFFFDVGGCEGWPPLFMGTSDSSWSPCLPFAIGSTKTNDRSSLPCFTSAPAISVVSLFIVDARYNSDSESPDESTTLSGVHGYTRVYIYIYICKIDARIVRTLTLLHRAFATIALAIVWSRGVVRASMQVVFIPIDYGDYTSWPDTRARNSRNPNATGKLPSKNPTLEFHWTKCHHRVLTWTRRNGS